MWHTTCSRSMYPHKKYQRRSRRSVIVPSGKGQIKIPSPNLIPDQMIFHVKYAHDVSCPWPVSRHSPASPSRLSSLSSCAWSSASSVSTPSSAVRRHSSHTSCNTSYKPNVAWVAAICSNLRPWADMCPLVSCGPGRRWYRLPARRQSTPALLPALHRRNTSRRFSRSVRTLSMCF